MLIKDNLVKPDVVIKEGWYKGRHNNGLLGTKRGKYKIKN